MGPADHTINETVNLKTLINDERITNFPTYMNERTDKDTKDNYHIGQAGHWKYLCRVADSTRISSKKSWDKKTSTKFFIGGKTSSEAKLELREMWGANIRAENLFQRHQRNRMDKWIAGIRSRTSFSALRWQRRGTWHADNEKWYLELWKNRKET